jgi:hypothetical protein
VPLFEESEIEASHKGLTSSISGTIEVQIAATDLIRKADLAYDPRQLDTETAKDALSVIILAN